MLVGRAGAGAPDVAVRLLQGAAEHHPAAVDVGRGVLLGALSRWISCALACAALRRLARAGAPSGRRSMLWTA
jgi:hypothetical protein